LCDQKILLKNLRSYFESLRTNACLPEHRQRGASKIIGDFPFMLSLVEAFIGFTTRIIRKRHDRRSDDLIIVAAARREWKKKRGRQQPQA